MRRFGSGAFAALLLLAIFLLAATIVIRRTIEENSPDRVHLRFAHPYLQAGVREAFDEIARDFEAAHPGVLVTQLAVPPRLYPQWIATQLAGETAPDLVNLRGVNDERKARYFVPLSGALEVPNPYNAGTALASVPWRSTFLDGVTGMEAISIPLMEVYGVPVMAETVRLYVNRSLLERITGAPTPPADFGGLVALAERVRAYEEPGLSDLIPIAGSNLHAPMILRGALGATTQRLALQLDRTAARRFNARDAAFAYLAGEWDYQGAAPQAALELARSYAGMMQPGYFRQEAQDALFHFMQGRALMIAASSTESHALMRLAPFPVVVAPIPLPAPDHPRWGPFTLGSPAETDSVTGTLGLTRFSAHPDVALAFLRFLTSPVNSARFARRAGVLSAVVGVEPAPELRPFLPRPGLAPMAGPIVLGDGLLPNAGGLFQRQLHLLERRDGGVAAFVAAFEREAPVAFRRDLARHHRDRHGDTVRQDTLIATLQVLPAPVAGAREDEAWHTALMVQTLREAEAEHWALQLAEPESP